MIQKLNICEALIKNLSAKLLKKKKKKKDRMTLKNRVGNEIPRSLFEESNNNYAS